MTGIATYLVSSPRRVMAVLVASVVIVVALQFAPVFDGTSGSPVAPGVGAQQVVAANSVSQFYAALLDAPREVPVNTARVESETVNSGGHGLSQPSDPPVDGESDAGVLIPVTVPYDSSVPAADQPESLFLRPTFSWVNAFGDSSTLNAQPVRIGDVITAFDPDGTLVGRFTVISEGQFGLMALYQDDPATRVDEGADPGDLISFKINGVPAVSVGPQEPIWLANGSILMSNLAAVGS